MYGRSTKQIFILIDTTEILSNQAQKVINDHTVLELERGGGENYSGGHGMSKMPNKMEIKYKVSYNKLWKLLIDKGVQKKDLKEKCDI